VNEQQQEQKCCKKTTTVTGLSRTNVLQNCKHLTHNACKQTKNEHTDIYVTHETVTKKTENTRFLPASTKMNSIQLHISFSTATLVKCYKEVYQKFMSATQLYTTINIAKLTNDVDGQYQKLAFHKSHTNQTATQTN